MKKQLEKRGFMYNLRRAFTITELVIVIAVVAVLAAVLIPTFSNVIENSKRSHDEQFVKEINVALSAYNTKHGKTPEDYPELMSALDEAGLCDSSNYFLLGTKLKQKDMYLIWYRNANSVVLLDGSESSDYIIQFTSSIGMGNAVYVFDKTAAGGTQIGYALCTTGMKDGEYFAQLYKDFYEESAGSMDTFFQKFGNKYSAENILGSVNNAAWGNNVIDALKNQQQGYAYSESTANSIKQQAATGSTVNIGITELPENPTAEQVTQVQQEVRSALATLTTLANTSVDAAALEGTTIQLASKDSGNVDTALSDVTVDMSEVQMTAIGNVYRKTYEKAEKIDDVTGSFSVNFGGLTIENMHVAQSELVSSGAEYQTEQDCSYPGGAYVFTYGLFGTVNAKEGTVTISNINVKGVDMDLNGASESIGGQTYPTISDMAGIIVGYTQGNVVFENITIDGTKEDGSKGLFSGFDGVAGLVGRAYGKVTAFKNTSTVTIRNCDISNMAIKGQRRAAGFVAYAGRQVNVVIEDSTLTNVDISCVRTDKKSGTYSGAIGHFSTSGVQETNTTCVFDGVVLTDVTTEISYNDAEGNVYSFPNADASNFLSASKFYYAKVGDSYISIIMPDSNPLGNEASDGSDKVIQGDGLKIVANGVTYNVTSLTKGVAAVLEEV